MESGLTQKQIADILGIDRSTYSYYESGKIKLDVKTILNLSKIFGVDYTEILDAEQSSICADATRPVARTTPRGAKDCFNIPVGNDLSPAEENLLLSLRLLPSDVCTEVMNIISEKLKAERRKHRRDFRGISVPDVDL